MSKVVTFIEKYGTAALLGYAVLSTLPLFLIDAEFNVPFAIAFKYLSVPVVALVWYVGWRYKDEFIARCTSRVSYWMMLVCLPPLIILWAGGLVVAANALIPPQSEYRLNGVAVSKTKTGKNGKEHVVDVRTPDGIKRIYVSKSDFDQILPGSQISQARRRGSLGFTYVWKY